MAPLYLGIKAVIAKSFARIHRSNLINAGILPFTFVNADDYNKISEGDDLVLNNLIESINGSGETILKNKTNKAEIPVVCELSERAKKIILSGGLLDYTKKTI